MTLTTIDRTEPHSSGVLLGDQPQFLAVAQASKLLRVSTWLLYQAIRAGELPVIRWGRRVVIQREDLAAFVHSRRDEGLRTPTRVSRLNTEPGSNRIGTINRPTATTRVD
jgi:excisionase family DNA binding protein